MRPLQFNAIEFIVQYDEAMKADLTMQEMADLFGYSYGTVRQRRYALRDRGIVLPALRHGLEGKPSNNLAIREGKRPLRLVDKRQVPEIPDARTPVTYLIGHDVDAFSFTAGD